MYSMCTLYIEFSTLLNKIYITYKNIRLQAQHVCSLVALHVESLVNRQLKKENSKTVYYHDSRNRKKL